jgi:hypothetical protein
VKAVDGAAFRQEHEWTFSRNYVDAPLHAELNSFSANGSLASSAIHPDHCYACLGAIAHYSFGYCRTGHQEGCLDEGWHILQACETLSGVDLCGVGIYGNHVVTLEAEFLEEFAAEVRRIARDSYHRDALSSKELMNRFNGRLHRLSRSRAIELL